MPGEIAHRGTGLVDSASALAHVTNPGRVSVVDSDFQLTDRFWGIGLVGGWAPYEKHEVGTKASDTLRTGSSRCIHRTHSSPVLGPTDLHALPACA